MSLDTNPEVHLIHEPDAEQHYSDVIVVSFSRYDLDKLKQLAKKSDEVRGIAVAGPSSVEACVGQLTLLMSDHLPECFDGNREEDIRVSIFVDQDRETMGDFLLSHPARWTAGHHRWSIYPDGHMSLAVNEHFPSPFLHVDSIPLDKIRAMFEAPPREVVKSENWFMVRI